MDQKVLLAQSITLLYLESLLTPRTENSSQVVKQMVEELKVPEASLDSDSNREIILGLRSTILHLCSLPDSQAIDRESLLQRLRLNTRADLTFAPIIEATLPTTDDQTIIKKKIVEYSRLINTHNREKTFRDLFKKYTADIVYGRQDVPLDTRTIAMQIQAELDKFTLDAKATGPMGITGVVGMVDLTDADSIAKVLDEAIDETGTDGVLRTGIKAMNRMFGWHGGFRRGDFWVVGAMEHNYKTGFTLNLTKHVAIYNKPYMLDEKKKPMIIHISSENALTDNVLLMYGSLKENETLEQCNVQDIDRDYALNYIREQTMVNGYTLHMLRVNPSEFNYQSLFQLIMQYEADGYEIHLLTIDYLNMFSKVGCTQGAQGMDTRDLFRRVRNFCAPRKITVITPHQISSEAKNLIRMGVDNFVAEIAGKAYWDSCRTLEQEVDGSILINIEKRGERSYLAVQRGKHRKSGPMTPQRDMYTVLPFFDVGAIRDDINGTDLSMKKPGADQAGGSASESNSWF